MTNKEAINHGKEQLEIFGGEHKEFIELAIKALEQKQKVGKWIKTYEPNDAEPFILWECSECQNTERGRRRSKYCPNCGAKMEVDE